VNNTSPTETSKFLEATSSRHKQVSFWKTHKDTDMFAYGNGQLAADPPVLNWLQGDASDF